EGDWRVGDRVRPIGQRVTGRGRAELRHRADVARRQFRNRLLVLPPHYVELADPLVVVPRRVVDVRVAVQYSRVDAEIGQLADVRVRHRFENEGGDGRAVVRRAALFL